MATSRRDNGNDPVKDHEGDKKKDSDQAATSGDAGSTPSSGPVVTHVKRAHTDAWEKLLETSPWSAKPAARGESPGVPAVTARPGAAPPGGDVTQRWSGQVWRTPSVGDATPIAEAPAEVPAVETVLPAEPAVETVLPAEPAVEAVLPVEPAVDAAPADAPEDAAVTIELPVDAGEDVAVAGETELAAAESDLAVPEVVVETALTLDEPTAEVVPTDVIAEPAATPAPERLSVGQRDDRAAASGRQMGAAASRLAELVEQVRAEGGPFLERLTVAPVEPDEPAPDDIAEIAPPVAVPDEIPLPVVPVEPDVVAPDEVVDVVPPVSVPDEIPAPVVVAFDVPASVQIPAEPLTEQSLPADLPEAPAVGAQVFDQPVRQRAAAKRGPAVKEIPTEDLFGGMIGMADSAVRGLGVIGVGLAGGLVKGGRQLWSGLASGATWLSGAKAPCVNCVAPERCDGKENEGRGQ